MIFIDKNQLINISLIFIARKLQLAIEVDGESHYGKEEYDLKRQKRIESFGITFLRFDDMEVRYNLDKVIKTIEEWIDKHNLLHTPRPSF